MQKNNNIISLLFFSFLTGIIFSFFKIYSADIFWHISVGKNYFINSNIFSWAFPDHSWISTYRPFSKIIYLIYHYSGFIGLYLFKGGMITLISVLTTYSVYKRSNDLLVSVLVVLLLFDLSLFRLLLRPHMFTFLFLIVILFYERKLIDFNLKLKDKLFLLLIFLLWGNFHAGVVFGLIMVGFIVIVGLLNSHDNYKEPIIFLFLLFLVTMINPNGSFLYKYLTQHLGFEHFIKIDELSSLSYIRNPRYFYLICFMIFFPLSDKSDYKKKILYLLFIIPFNIFLLSKGKRFIPITSIFSLLPWLYYKPSIKIKTLGLRNALIFIILILYCLNLYFFKIKKNKELAAGIGINKKLFPYEEVAYLKNVQANRILNSLGTGGFLISKGLRPFIDGRVHAYPFQIFKDLNIANSSRKEFSLFLEKWQFDAILIDKSEYYIHQSLLNSDWEIIRTEPFFLAVKDNK